MEKLTLERMLEHCLQEIARTGDVEAVLRRYPQHASQLRPLLEMAMTTGRYYATVPEPPGGLAGGRARLLATATQQRARMQATTIPTRKGKRRQQRMKLFFVTRLISAILAVVIGAAAVGGGVAWAGNDSLPGDFFYPVKLTIEDFRMDLAPTTEAQVNLALQFAEERTGEIEALVGAGLPVPEQVMARMEQHFQHALRQAAGAPEEEMPGLLERIAQRTQMQVQVLARVRAMAPEEAQVGLERALRICQREHEAAMAGLGDPQTFRMRYQHRDSMPEDVTPPEPPTREPQEGNGPGPHGPGGPDEPDENQMDSSQDERPGDRDQDREDDPQQDQDRDRQQDRQGDPQQDEGRNQQPEQQPDQERDQQRDQQPDQERDQQQDPQRDGQSGETKGSGGPGS